MLTFIVEEWRGMNMIVSEAKISSKRQITLPIKVMKKLGLGPGDSLAFDDKGEYFVICPKNENISALDIHKKFSHLPKKKVSQTHIDKAREGAYLSKF
ncbi:MAG: AbrB family looped-hinge helix DNA binding protein [Candidatus Omnitrophota bacterium]|jgi:AbrB family looped-hinge helix DNA binding protein